MVFSLLSGAADALSGMFMAMTVYGGHNLPPAYMVGNGNGAQRDDNYRAYLAAEGWQLLDQTQLTTFNGGGKAEFRVGGLYNAKVTTATTSSWDAQALIARRDDRMVIAFRGTDPADPSVVSGQAFLGEALAANYKAFGPLRAAALDYIVAHPEIKRVVVSGHSLGGALADVFAMKDAADFRAVLPAGGLVIEAIASSGVPPDLPTFTSGFNKSVVAIGHQTVISAGGIKVQVPIVSGLTPPDDYVAFANLHDRVRWAKNFGNDATTLGLVPILPLKNNLHMGGDIVFDNPNMDNADVSYADPIKHPLDFRGFGANHNSGLYWNDLYGLVNDPQFPHYDSQRLTFGIADYKSSPDWTGAPISLFYGYVKLNKLRNDWDTAGHSLAGTAGADFIVSLSGNDAATGAAGDDILSGGDGGDVLNGGPGNDRLDGGKGSDSLTGAAGTDTLTGGTGADTFAFSAVTDSLPGVRRDTITDFHVAQNDRIDLSRIQAVTTATNKHLHLTGNGGADPFSGVPGEVHWWTSGGVTLVQADVDGNGVADFEIALTGGPQPAVSSFVL